jgi:hypothetical protein
MYNEELHSYTARHLLSGERIREYRDLFSSKKEYFRFLMSAFVSPIFSGGSGEKWPAACTRYTLDCSVLLVACLGEMRNA